MGNTFPRWLGTRLGDCLVEPMNLLIHLDIRFTIQEHTHHVRSRSLGLTWTAVPPIKPLANRPKAAPFPLPFPPRAPPPLLLCARGPVGITTFSCSVTVAVAVASEGRLDWTGDTFLAALAFKASEEMPHSVKSNESSASSSSPGSSAQSIRFLGELFGFGDVVIVVVALSG